MQSNAALTSPIEMGRYRLGDRLSSGGMASIFLAYDGLAQREVAYKRLSVCEERSRPHLTALFEREYETLRKLSHPNIVEAYDYGIDEVGCFYTMELLRGRRLNAGAPLPVSETCRLLRDIASALALVHTRRILHRDVTASNVLLSSDGCAKLIDFGAVCPFGIVREVVGTPPYVAPESLAGEPLDQRTDLYALGALAYWMLTARHAFAARTFGELVLCWEIEPGPPSALRQGVPRALDELVLALLEQDSMARPASAAEVCERLTTIAGLPPEEHEAKVAHGYLADPPLVGRSTPRSTLRAHCEHAMRGSGASVFVEAGPGLGRTALLDQVSLDAELMRASVFRFRPERERAGSLMRSLLRWLTVVVPDLTSAAAARNPALRALVMRAEGSTAAYLALRATQRMTEAGAESLLAEVQDVLLSFSQRSPVALMIDDVHRLDPESLAFLTALAPATRTTALLLVCSRPSPERAVTPEGALAAASENIRLSALTPDDLELLVDYVFGGVPNSRRLAAWLFALSGGNPAQCIDLCRLLLQRGKIRYAVGTFTLPFDLERVDAGDILRTPLNFVRLRELSPEALRLAQALSLLDRTLSIPQLAEILSRSVREVVEDGAELRTHDIARTAGESMALVSESMREALQASLGQGQRTELHEAVAAVVLGGSDGSVEARLLAADHLVKAGNTERAIVLVWGILRDDVLPFGSLAAFVPSLERMLQTLRDQDEPDEHLAPLMFPLVAAGFWGDLSALRRHRDSALAALARATGMALARRCAPYLGKRLALYLGLFTGIIRHRLTPRRFRLKSYRHTLQVFLGAGGVSIAASAAGFEPIVALRLASYFEPLEALPERHPARIAHEFCVATAEVGAGRLARAAARYRWILDELSRPDTRFDPLRIQSFVEASLHGCAQAEIAAGGSSPLAKVELLAQSSQLFKPHVEFLKMGYHLERGEKEAAEIYRRRGEVLARFGSASWTALTSMLVRQAYYSMLTGDNVGVARASHEFERAAATVPGIAVFVSRCRAYAELSSGRPDVAVKLLEDQFLSEQARLLPTWMADRTLYAEALSQVGRLHEARSVCEELVNAFEHEVASAYELRFPVQRLALILAQLGDIEAARARMEQLRSVVIASGNPLAIGCFHRDAARICLLARDENAFGTHLTAMARAFRSTENPALIQQCRQLANDAERDGLLSAIEVTERYLAALSGTFPVRRASQRPPPMVAEEPCTTKG